MKKLLVLFFVAVMCIPSYGSILVYKTTTATTEFGLTAPGTMTKISEKGYLVIDVNLETQEVASAQQVTYGGSSQEAKIADVAFHSLTGPGYIVAEYLCGDKDATLSGKVAQTDVGFGTTNKKLAAKSLKGSVLVSNEVIGSGTMNATLDTKLTKAANGNGDSIAVVVGDIQDNLVGKYGQPVVDTTPPEPNVMTFAVAPAAASDTTITMTATTAVDAETPPVEYLFTNVTDPNKGSAWQSSPTFTDTGLTDNTTYTYNVTARDSAAPTRNRTAASADANATTDQTADTTPPDPNVMTFAVDPNAISDSEITMTATTATDVHGVQYFFTNVTDPNHNSGWQDEATYTDTGLAANTTYTYNVKARDKSTAHNATAASADANATTDEDTSAPSPDPMTWAIEPTANGSTSITMKATRASDTSGPVQYEFWRTTGTTAIVRAYSADANYVPTGLTENTIYGYKVRAKDTLGNATGFSATKTAQTGKTIQTQINEALALRTGSEPITVTIAAGTYIGDIAVNDPNVTLKAGDANTIIQLVDGVGIDIQGGAASFILDGFTIAPHATDTTFAIQVTNNPLDVNIANNIIDVNSNAASMAISIGAAGAENLTIIGNTIMIGSGDGGIWGVDMVSASVLDNTISGPAAHLTSGYGIQFAGITGTSLINGNTLTNCGSGIFITGIQPAATGTTIAENVTISDNTISQCQKGIRLGHNTQLSDMNDIYVYDNTLQSNVIGIYVDTHATLIDADTFDVSGNSFLGNITSGLENADADTLPAELNWWGAASGPYHTTNTAGTGDTITGAAVDFDPWYTSSAMDANSND